MELRFCECGNAPRIVKNGDDNLVRCEQCGRETKCYTSRQNAVKAWNAGRLGYDPRMEQVSDIARIITGEEGEGTCGDCGKCGYFDACCERFIAERIYDTGYRRQGKDLREVKMQSPCETCIYVRTRREGHRVFTFCSDAEKARGFVYDDFLYRHKCVNHTPFDRCVTCRKYQSPYCDDNHTPCWYDPKN